MEIEAAPGAAAALSADDVAAQAEQQYTAELQKELTGRVDAEAAAAAELSEAPEKTAEVCKLM